MLIIIVCTLSGILRIVKHSMWYFENCKVYGLPSGGLKQGELPLCTELPVRFFSATRIHTLAYQYGIGVYGNGTFVHRITEKSSSRKLGFRLSWSRPGVFAVTGEKDLPKGFSVGVSLWGLRSLCVWPTLLAGKRRSPRKRRGREVLHVLVGLLANNSLSRPLLVSFSTTVMLGIRQTD